LTRPDLTDPDERLPDLREQARLQMLDAMGGWSGTIVASVPPIVFVIANTIGGLSTALIAALVAAAVMAIYRVVRREPLQQAFFGVLSVGIAAFIAWRMGEARGFFVWGIAWTVVYAIAFAISLIVRRPLVGVFWEFLEPSHLPEGTHWYQVRGLRRAYDYATAAGFAMFATRALVQLKLFAENKTGLLAVARIAMGFPLYIAVVAFGFWVVRRARHELPAVADAAPDGQQVPIDPSALD